MHVHSWAWSFWRIVKHHDQAQLLVCDSPRRLEGQLLNLSFLCALGGRPSNTLSSERSSAVVAVVYKIFAIIAETILSYLNVRKFKKSMGMTSDRVTSAQTTDTSIRLITSHIWYINLLLSFLLALI